MFRQGEIGVRHEVLSDAGQFAGSMVARGARHSRVRHHPDVDTPQHILAETPDVSSALPSMFSTATRVTMFDAVVPDFIVTAFP